MADIKIFVSHRIDIDSELIENPLYVPVRCGAVFDSENPNHLIGDDTGDNISEKRMSFCELTVQYWAWKNVEADYYGLCHYRRYLSFAKKNYRTDSYNVIYEPRMLNVKKYGLLSETLMRNEIEKYDIVIPYCANVRRMPSPSGYQTSVRLWWTSQEGIYFENDTVKCVCSLIDLFAPSYSEAARKYLDGTEFRGNSCYIMCNALFNELCNFEFPILFEMERQSRGKKDIGRMPGYVGEILFGIFVQKILDEKEQWRIAERQMIFFRNAKRISSKSQKRKYVILTFLEKSFRYIADGCFPKGSKTREKIKSILCCNR